MFTCDAVLNGNGENAREMGTFRGSGRYREAVAVAQQLPNKSLRSNARNAVTGKSLAKCEKPLCLRHFGEY